MLNLCYLGRPFKLFRTYINGPLRWLEHLKRPIRRIEQIPQEKGRLSMVSGNKGESQGSGKIRVDPRTKANNLCGGKADLTAGIAASHMRDHVHLNH